jgi:hypothetical protein
MPPGDGLAAAQTVMTAIDGLMMGPDSSVRTTYLGDELTLSPEQAGRVRATARAALGRALDRSLQRAESAMGRYRDQEDVNDEFPVTSRAAKAWAFLRTLGDYSNPGEALEKLQFSIAVEAAVARNLLAAGAFAQAAEHVANVDAASERSARLVRAYVDQLIEGAGSLAVGLEYTRDAAFITVGVLAVVVSGGAAAGVAPGVIGTGVGGLSVGGTATAISVGAPIVASAGAGAVRAAYGDKVDWGAIAVDAAVQVVLAKIGGRLSETIFARLVGNPAGRTLARQAFASLISGLATHEVSQAFSVSVHEAFDLLRGRDVTWAEFARELEARLSDPHGLFMAALMSGVQLGAHVAVGRATQGPPAPAGEVAAKPAATTGPAPAQGSAGPAAGHGEPARPVAPKAAAHEGEPTRPVAPKAAAHEGEPARPVTPQRPTAPARPVKRPATQPKPATSRPARRTAEGPLGARRPGSRSRFAEGEGAVEAVRAADAHVSLEQRGRASGGTRSEATPVRSPGPRRPAASPKKAATKAAAPKQAAAKGAVSPISERVLVGDLENGLPTGVTGELHPSDLHTGSPSSSDVNPPGLETGELDPLGARRGHLLANLFGGSGRDPRNLAWMHKRINNSDFKVQFENPVRRALEAGQPVRFGIRPKFRPGELAPYEVEVWATTPGGKQVVPVRAIATPGLSDIIRSPGDR